MLPRGLEIGFQLDRQWYLLRGEMDRTKRPVLVSLAQILAASRTPYAIIDGIAVQIHQDDPRTTLDIDLAVLGLDAIPRAELEAAGFIRRGRFSHSEDWLSQEGTPVQFTGDPALAGAIGRAEDAPLDDVTLRIIGRVDLLHEKLRAGTDPARRRSKRLQDLADAQAPLEATPALHSELPEAERQVLDGLP